MIGHFRTPVEAPREYPTVREVVFEHTLFVLEEFNGNKTQTAKALGISIRTLRNWLNTNNLRDACEKYKSKGYGLDVKTIPKPRSVPVVDPKNYDPKTGLKLRPGDGQDA